MRGIGIYVVACVIMLGLVAALAYGLRHRAEVECAATCAPRPGVIRGRDYLCFCEIESPDGRKILEMQ